MTRAILYQTGTKLLMPSGGLAVLVRWKVKSINPENRKEGIERVATLRLLHAGANDADVDFSEGFIRLCKVIA